MAISAFRFIVLAVVAVVLGVLSASFAFGQQGPGIYGIANNELNGRLAHPGIDKDNAISLSEINEMRSVHFARFDNGRDGAVSQAEVETAVRERVEKITGRIILCFDKDATDRSHEKSLTR